jgi:dihydrodipicolinate synthase/N-acetylneuraminate lyase
MNPTRREFLAGLTATAAVTAGRRAGAAESKPMRGAFMILSTPFTTAGEVHWSDLEREARFVDRCGCHGIVWPQGSSSVATLTRDERMRGLEVLAGALPARRAALVLGVQGRDTSEMLEYARKAETLSPDAMIAMPPSSGQTEDDYYAYFRALAGVTERPVIVQTSGGNRSLAPSVELIVKLAREFPQFGYVKEETPPVLERMRAELAARPPMKRVFGASFADNWLYEMRLGLDGVITGNAMFADLMAQLWTLHDAGRRDAVREAFSVFLLMRNLEEQIPGANRYIMKMRGIFSTTVTRIAAPQPGAAPRTSDLTLPADAIAEIEYRFEALKPYLQRVS